MEDIKTLGENLRILRQRAKMSRKELSARINWSVPSIAKLERGVAKNVKIEIVFKIMKVFNYHKDVKTLYTKVLENV